MTVILPTTFLLNDDGKTVWGYCKAEVANNTLLRVSLGLKDKPEDEPAWQSVFELTIVQGHIACRNLLAERRATIDGSGRIREERGGSEVRDEQGRVRSSITSLEAYRNTGRIEGDHPDICPSTLGEDEDRENGEG